MRLCIHPLSFFQLKNGEKGKENTFEYGIIDLVVFKVLMQGIGCLFWQEELGFLVCKHGKGYLWRAWLVCFITSSVG